MTNLIIVEKVMRTLTSKFDHVVAAKRNQKILKQ